MAFLQGDNKYRPRTKKEKQRLQEQRKRAQAAKREREQHQREAPAFTPNYSYPRRNQNINISSKFMSRIEDDKSAESVEYTEEMQAREAAARKEAERRKKCVAPAFNKGPYQYIFTEEQAKDVGRS
ncbi:MAG: hypothetical protein CMP47_12455 [Rickettsiales bacterium]|nr:hypothetical protein [Rickettsiales bacterium]|tara:strand:+ start:473 stop:850 length:378 start_codon:yes stop_codon:yes gene_type:complete